MYILTIWYARVSVTASVCLRQSTRADVLLMVQLTSLAWYWAVRSGLLQFMAGEVAVPDMEMARWKKPEKRNTWFIWGMKGGRKETGKGVGESRSIRETNKKIQTYLQILLWKKPESVLICNHNISGSSICWNISLIECNSGTSQKMMCLRNEQKKLYFQPHHCNILKFLW